jgi:hypothetical protein
MGKVYPRLSAGETILRSVNISGNEWLKIFSESAIIGVIRGKKFQALICPADIRG